MENQDLMQENPENEFSRRNSDENSDDDAAKSLEPMQTIFVGPTQIPVNARIWNSIATTRSINQYYPVAGSSWQSPLPSPILLSPSPSYSTVISSSTSESTVISSSTSEFALVPSPVHSAVPSYSSRQSVQFSNFSSSNNSPVPFKIEKRIVSFRREFGPVPTPEGIELRLRYGIKINMAANGNILVDCGDIRASVSPRNHSCAVEHPNGRIFQVNDRIDLIAFDGYQNNNFIRFAKVLKDSILLTFEGCVLIYLLDCVGTRTSGSPHNINRDWNKDYCKLVYYKNLVPMAANTLNLPENYSFSTDENNVETFILGNFRVSQKPDGMMKIVLNDTIIRTSITNSSITLKTPSIHFTASMGDSPHMFIRNYERRIHFDGAKFIARNFGHTLTFDEENNLHID